MWTISVSTIADRENLHEKIFTKGVGVCTH